MANPLREDDLTRVAAYLAAQRAAQQGRPVPKAVRRVFRATPEGYETADLEGDRPVLGRRPESDRAALQGEGYEWLSGDEYASAVANAGNTARPPPGKLPFISGVRVHQEGAAPPPARPTYDPAMTAAMGKAAQASRQLAGDAQALLPADGSRRAKPQPPPAAQKASRARELLVRSTSETGSTPELRAPAPTGPRVPPNATALLSSLPEGVASVMRKRWGLEDAQADANRRSLAVELASAGDQIGRGFAGVGYNDNTWDTLRTAARQPVADYQQRAEEERTQDEVARRAAEDEREARAAEAAARMEMERFNYTKQRDTASDTLARDRMKQDKDIADARLKAEGTDRWLRREEMRLRREEAAEEKKTSAAAKETAMKERQDEKDQQELAKRLQAAADAKPDLDLVMRYATSPSSEDVPGVGWGVGGLPGAMVSQEGSDLRSAAIRLYRAKTRMESGQTVTPQEAATALEARGMGTWKTDDQWRSGMKALANETAVAMRNVESGFNPGVVAARRERGGITSADIPTSPIRMVSPEGQEYEVDQDEVLEAQRNGWKVR